jgi:hypothetical protein
MPVINRQLTPQQKAAKWLIEHPAEFGRRIGFTKLRDDLHGEWINDMLWREDDQTKQAHRGSYKTSCLEVAMALICMTHRDKNTIFLRKTDNDVAEVMQAVQSILLHPLTQAMSQVMTGKPLELYTATNKKITTSFYAHPGGAPQILGIGVGGSLTGKHGDIIITDDIVNRLDRQSRAERERTKLIYQELQNLRNPGGRFINTGTPWHKEDAFSLMPAPEKWDCYQTGLLSSQKIEELKMQMSPSLFAANYELKHIASDGALFSTSRPIEDAADKLRDGIAHIDAGYGGGDGTAFSCCQRIGDTIYLYGRLWDAHVDTVLNTAIYEADQFRCGPIYCELNGDKGYLSKEIRNRGGYAFGYTENQNKYIKISSYLKKWWKNIVFIKGTDPKYIEQIMDYTDAAEHDDAPDSASCCCRIMDGR